MRIKDDKIRRIKRRWFLGREGGVEVVVGFGGRS